MRRINLPRNHWSMDTSNPVFMKKGCHSLRERECLDHGGGPVLIPSNFHSKDSESMYALLALCSKTILHQDQGNGSHCTKSHNCPSGSNDLLIRECCTCVPHKMSDAIDRMKREWHRYDTFDSELCCNREGSEGRRQSRNIKMPPKQW